MKIKCFILLLALTSCLSVEEELNEIKIYSKNVDSLFLSVDNTVKTIISNREEKVLLEQDLWRKKRDIKNIHKIYTDSIWNLSNMYELNTIKLDSDSVQYNYKIILREIVDTVRIVVTDSICNVCETKQNKRDNRWYKKTFRWIKNI
jgi:hypothetical protein|tara:strand:+ start:742 stop:1182 length:441 start_codon:yes stop_codon:yes gene_type:complete